MPITRLTFAPDGALSHATSLLPGAPDLPPPGANERDVDQDTNPALVTALDTAAGSLRLVGGAVRLDGVTVVVNPPGQAEQERITPANVATVLGQLQAYRDVASPTNAQTLAAVKLLCRIAQFLVRRSVT